MQFHRHSRDKRLREDEYLDVKDTDGSSIHKLYGKNEKPIQVYIPIIFISTVPIIGLKPDLICRWTPHAWHGQTEALSEEGNPSSRSQAKLYSKRKVKGRVRANAKANANAWTSHWARIGGICCILEECSWSAKQWKGTFLIWWPPAPTMSIFRALQNMCLPFHHLWDLAPLIQNRSVLTFWEGEQKPTWRSRCSMQ